MSLKTQIAEDMKSAMRAKDAPRLAAIRLLMAGVKQREVDERIELDDAAITAVVEKQIKQRRDAITQYEAGGRPELADAERFEIEVVLQAYLPEPLSADAVAAIIRQAIADTGAAGAKDMGKVMAAVKPQIAGRADMGAVSAQIKGALGS
ncbi:MAG: GatB/YqeY domain-containing protein [Betaproteobacteria bacterium]|nr:GatB/YqeY domain-containing protein [Betaproteobacteria bacterium]